MLLKSGQYGWNVLERTSGDGGHPVARGFPDRLRSNGRILGSVEINRSISASEHSVTPIFVLRMKKRSKQEQDSAALWEWERAELRGARYCSGSSARDVRCARLGTGRRCAAADRQTLNF